MTIETMMQRSFGDSPIDEKRVRAFLKDDPYYLGWAYDQELDEPEKDLFNKLDFFEFHFRRYLLNRPKTLHRVLYEVRDFVKANPNDAAYYINYVLDEVRKTMMAEEWYELVPRLDSAAKKIKALLPEVDTEAIPLTFFALQETYPGHAKMRAPK